MMGLRKKLWRTITFKQRERSLERQLRRSNYRGRKKKKPRKAGVIVTKKKRV